MLRCFIPFNKWQFLGYRGKTFAVQESKGFLLREILRQSFYLPVPYKLVSPLKSTLQIWLLFCTSRWCYPRDVWDIVNQYPTQSFLIHSYPRIPKQCLCLHHICRHLIPHPFSQKLPHSAVSFTKGPFHRHHTFAFPQQHLCSQVSSHFGL